MDERLKEELAEARKAKRGKTKLFNDFSPEELMIYTDKLKEHVGIDETEIKITEKTRRVCYLRWVKADRIEALATALPNRKAVFFIRRNSQIKSARLFGAGAIRELVHILGLASTRNGARTPFEKYTSTVFEVGEFDEMWDGTMFLKEEASEIAFAKKQGLI